MTAREPSPSAARWSLTTVLPTDSVPSFLITEQERSFRHQYANIYYIRLSLLKNFVEERAVDLWKGLDGSPISVPRVLDVTKGQLCYIIGTVYIDMPLKPNVIDDITRDQSLPAPPPPPHYYSNDDCIMLEDESGRIKLVGERLKDAQLVTGVVMGALGMETAGGDFEVADFCFADTTSRKSQEAVSDDMDVDTASQSTRDEWIAIVSGLDIGSHTPDDPKIQMLAEYLTGEVGGTDEQLLSTQISRLIVAGNSLTPVIEPNDDVPELRARRPAQEITPASPHPIIGLSALLNEISQTMPVHILPGENDPAGILLPQQPFPRSMFGPISELATIHCETNPTYLCIRCDEPSMTRTLLINSGQPLNDMFKYLPAPPNTRLDVLESTLRWRHMAPTAPDTLWCRPYFTKDPFLLTIFPDLYIVGCQKQFGTRLVNSGRKGINAQDCRIVMSPNFADTGILVLLNIRTLDAKTVCFGTDCADGTVDDSQLRAPSVPATESPPESIAGTSPPQEMLA